MMASAALSMDSLDTWGNNFYYLPFHAHIEFLSTFPGHGN